jgi:hypothetical protein
VQLQPLEFWQRAQIALKTADGMLYLHNNHIVHMDFKCLNEFVDLRCLSDPGVAVGDLGISSCRAAHSKLARVEAACAGEWLLEGCVWFQDLYEPHFRRILVVKATQSMQVTYSNGAGCSSVAHVCVAKKQTIILQTLPNHTYALPLLLSLLQDGAWAVLWRAESAPLKQSDSQDCIAQARCSIRMAFVLPPSCKLEPRTQS